MAKKFTPGSSKPTTYTPQQWFEFHLAKVIDVEFSKSDIIRSVIWHEAQRQANSAEGRKAKVDADELYSEGCETYGV